MRRDTLEIMEAAERDRVIEALKAFFAKRDEFAAAYLYGSVARGSATAKSDVDVGVLRRVAAPTTLAGLPSLLAEELTQTIGRAVEVIWLNEAPADLVHRVLRDGVLLAEFDRSRRVQFTVQKQNEYFDLLPMLRAYRRGAKGLP